MRAIILRTTMLLALGVGLANCMTDDLRWQSSTTFTVRTTSPPSLALAGDTVQFQLQVDPDQPLTGSTYSVSYQNAQPALPVSVQMGHHPIERGKWKPLPERSSRVSLRCDSVGQPKLLFFVRDQIGNLQSVEVSYTTIR